MGRHPWCRKCQHEPGLLIARSFDSHRYFWRSGLPVDAKSSNDSEDHLRHGALDIGTMRGRRKGGAEVREEQVGRKGASGELLGRATVKRILP